MRKFILIIAAFVLFASINVTSHKRVKQMRRRG